MNIHTPGRGADEYRLVRVSMDGDHEAGKFNAASVVDACKRHMREWHDRTTSHAIVMILPNGTRHSYRDSAIIVADAE